jgi:chromosome segregation ATPase
MEGDTHKLLWQCHRCVAFAVNARLQSITMKIEWFSYSLPAEECDDARTESNESQQSAMSIFNEQKRLETQMDCMKDEVSRSNKAVDKMRDEVVRLRGKVNELQHEKSDLKKQHESHIADEESAVRERDTVMADLRSLLDRRNQQLNDMERY